MKKILPLIALTLISCQKNEPVAKPIDQAFGASLAGEAVAGLKSKIGDTRVLMICGPSAGKGLEQKPDGSRQWIDDGISEGRLAFTWQDHGAPDYYFRDASGQWTGATEDGGEVRQVREDESSGAQVWTISYASTGVTETHNIQKVGESFVDVWTSNKPNNVLAPIPSSAKLFTANCVRP